MLLRSEGQVQILVYAAGNARNTAPRPGRAAASCMDAHVTMTMMKVLSSAHVRFTDEWSTLNQAPNAKPEACADEMAQLALRMSSFLAGSGGAGG